MLGKAGYLWIIVSILHGICGVIFYFKQWLAIAQDGWFNVVAPNPFMPIFEREDAFWFMFLTPFIFLIWNLCLWANRQKLTLPISISSTVLATVLVGIFLMPVSGIWLALPPSIMMFWNSWQSKFSPKPSSMS
jgi:hypothetical protein